MPVHISRVCVWLKIDSGISRALFIAVKAFNPFTSGFKQSDVGSQAGDEKRSVNEERNVNLMHEPFKYFAPIFISVKATTAGKLDS